MFGVVPRKLWAKVCPPDDENRIRMNMNCVFIDTGAEKILIETGIGDKWTAKQLSMYGIDRARPLSETLEMRTGLRRMKSRSSSTLICTSITPAAIRSSTLQANRYLRFQMLATLFRGAELDHAEHPTERDRASYLPENWRPVIESGQLEAKDCGLRSRAWSDDGNDRRAQSLDAVLATRSGTARRCLALPIWCRCERTFASVDHGLRPLSGGDSRSEEETVAAGGARRLDLFVLSRS